MGEPTVTDDFVRIGSADRTPMAPPIPRRTTLKGVLAVLGGSVLATACASKPDLSPIQAQATAQAKTPEEQRIEYKLGESWLSGITQINITSLSDGSVSSEAEGTGQVYLETDKHLFIVTAEHVGRGFFWDKVVLHFPRGYENTLTVVDANIAAPGGPAPTDDDWYIEYVSPHSQPDNGIFHPIRSIILRKPKGYRQYVVRPEYRVLTAPPAEPTHGDKWYVGGFPHDTQRGLVFSELTFDRKTTPDETDAGIPFFLFKGPGGGGMSGAAIVSEKGFVAGILSQGSKEYVKKPFILATPFAEYQPLDLALQIMEANKK